MFKISKRFQVVKSGVRGGKFYWSLPDKETLVLVKLFFVRAIDEGTVNVHSHPKEK